MSEKKDIKLKVWLANEYKEYKDLETERKSLDDPKYLENTQRIWVNDLKKIPIIHRQLAFNQRDILLQTIII
tara:strand:+ start:171 stop:386 length:216 start_codon:yes stop_codon:yes gene_type:complete